ncbi:MAG TPA: class I SAM-dependent rRNA methyltransferase [Vicinamibacteria bacterium]
MPVVRVSQRGRERILRGHLWVYRSDVRATDSPSSGDVVEVQDPAGGFLGRAFYSDSSQITLRLITTQDEAVDEDFWRRRLVEALARRSNLQPTTTAYRWVHGEADGIPSLVVDRYGDYLSFQTLTAGTDRLKECFLRLSVELAEPAGIMERNDQKARALEGLPLVKGAAFGEVPPAIPVQEAGVELRADLREGQKTGLFLDQRENRVAAGSYAAGKALDVFCYDGGFSLHLAFACESVLAVDTSAEALVRLRVNASVNGFRNIEPLQANGFDVLRELETREERFDTIVLDPPAFAKNRSSVPAARRGYKDINLRAMRLLRPGGVLVTSTCSYHISELDFVNILAAAAADSRSRMVLLEKRAQSRDHPILLAMPETHYLKCVILRKL